MSISLKVLWAEGLTLDAQHFQQLDLYHEARLRHIASAPGASSLHAGALKA